MRPGHSEPEGPRLHDPARQRIPSGAVGGEFGEEAFSVGLEIGLDPQPRIEFGGSFSRRFVTVDRSDDGGRGSEVAQFWVAP